WGGGAAWPRSQDYLRLGRKGLAFVACGSGGQVDMNASIGPHVYGRRAFLPGGADHAGHVGWGKDGGASAHVVQACLVSVVSFRRGLHHINHPRVSASMIARPMISATAGATAFPMPRFRSIPKGSPSAS